MLQEQTIFVFMILNVQIITVATESVLISLGNESAQKIFLLKIVLMVYINYA